MPGLFAIPQTRDGRHVWAVVRFDAALRARTQATFPSEIEARRYIRVTPHA